MRLVGVRLPRVLNRQGWLDCGFNVNSSGAVAVRNGAIMFCEDGQSPALVVQGATMEEMLDLEGLQIESGECMDGDQHPNGVLELDHIVIETSDVLRTSAQLERLLSLRALRVFERDSLVKMVFHRFAGTGDTKGCIVELVQNRSSPTDVPTALRGVVFNTPNLEATCSYLGAAKVGVIKAAKQNGRLIATMRAPLGTAVALMSKGKAKL